MALFEYFPNYIWNLSVAIAMESGAQIGEIVDMCQPIKDAAGGGADAGTPQFMAQWAAMGEKLIGLALASPLLLALAFIVDLVAG